MDSTFHARKSVLSKPYHRSQSNFSPKTINRVVATVLHNTSLKNKKAVRLIERVTVVPDLPRREVPAFKLFAREQGGALIDTLNDWLERRRGEQVRRRVGETGRLTAGLHVFAFIERNAR